MNISPKCTTCLNNSRCQKYYIQHNFESNPINDTMNTNKKMNDNIGILEKYHLDKLQELYISENFNESLSNLPKTLIRLEFSRNSKFNQPVDNLPQSLTKVTFGISFNQIVDKLPNQVKEIKFG